MKLSKVIEMETEEEIKKRRQREEEERERSKPKTDDDNSVTGSAIIDGMIGIPSSPTAILWDIATPGSGLF